MSGKKTGSVDCFTLKITVCFFGSIGFLIVLTEFWKSRNELDSISDWFLYCSSCDFDNCSFQRVANKMMIISFDWTTPALLAGRKTRTRRNWAEGHVTKFKPGDLVQAWDHQPRVKPSKRVGTIRIKSINREHIFTMKDEDYEKEGFAYLEEMGKKMWGKEPRQAFEDWRKEDRIYYVVDFELVETI